MDLCSVSVFMMFSSWVLAELPFVLETWHFPHDLHLPVASPCPLLLNSALPIEIFEFHFFSILCFMSQALCSMPAKLIFCM